MFSIAQRDRVRERVLELAASDPRVVAGAVVGSLALAEGDRWSDLDLTFAVAASSPVLQVLEDWTRTVTGEFAAVPLFDLPSGASIYRVFLLPGCLQFDLSFTPASAFAARGPKFRMLFGDPAKQAFAQPPPAQELFGYAVHHALRARFCIERGRYWQAEYWISGVRDYALDLACIAAACPRARVEGTMTFRPACATRFGAPWRLPWSETNCCARSAAPSMGCCVKPTRFSRWRRRSSLSCASLREPGTSNSTASAGSRLPPAPLPGRCLIHGR